MSTAFIPDPPPGLREVRLPSGAEPADRDSPGAAAAGTAAAGTAPEGVAPAGSVPSGAVSRGTNPSAARPGDPGQEAPATDAAGPDLGPLAGYVEDPEVTDVFVDGAGGLWSDGTAGLRRLPDPGWNEAEVRALAVRLVALGDRHIDEATPCVDVRLADGIRVHAVLPPISTGGTVISVRVPHRTPLSLDDLEAGGMLGATERAALESAVAERRNLLITGAAGSGKTTLLAALLSRAPAAERIVTIEDVAELRVRHPHVIALQARQPNLEGAGGVDLAKLLREALRMRPDRLVLGECRGAEVRELLTALNTGHDGGAGTLHANSTADVPARLEALGALAGLGAEATARQTVSGIDLIVHLGREDGVRRVAGLGRFTVDGSGRLAVVPA